jgi:hypothetical protein
MMATRFVLCQHDEVDFVSASLLKQQSAEDMDKMKPLCDIGGMNDIKYGKYDH